MRGRIATDGLIAGTGNADDLTLIIEGDSRTRAVTWQQGQGTDRRFARAIDYRQELQHLAAQAGAGAFA